MIDAPGSAAGVDRRRAMLWLTGAATTLAGCGGSSDDADPIAVAPQPIAQPQPTPQPTPAAPTPAPTPALPTGQANILVTGMSVWRGADLVPANYPNREAFLLDHAPAQYFRRALLGMPDFPATRVEYDNQAVGGSFDNEVAAQYDASRQRPHTIVFLGLAMNSGSSYGVYGMGPNAGSTKEVLRAQLRRIKADGALPLVANTVHPWPAKVTPESIAGSLWQGLNWPPERRTLFAYEPFVFDAAAATIARPEPAGSSTGLFNSPAGGTRIKAGSQLLIGYGANDGRVVVVTERVDATTVRVRPGDLVASERGMATIRHVNPPLEEIMDVPPSRQRVWRDWTGNGVVVDGLDSFALWNAILLDLCREEDVALLDFEYRGFRWVEQRGWPSVYETTYQGVTMSNSNHPVLDAQRVIYGELLAACAERYARGTLAPGFEVVRGPLVG